MEVVDYFGRDEILWPICLTCAELLAARAQGKPLLFDGNDQPKPAFSAVIAEAKKTVPAK